MDPKGALLYPAWLNPKARGWGSPVLSLASWKVTAATYGGSGDWLDEVGSVDAALPGGGSDPTWDSGNTEWDFVQADPAVEYLTMGNASVLDPGSGSFSLAMRVKLGSVTERQTIFTKRASTSTVPGWIAQVVGDSDDTPRLAICDGTTNVAIVGSAVSAGSYLTLAWCVDRDTDTGAFYLNGSDDTQSGSDISSVTGSLATTESALLGHFGDLTASGDVGLNGSLRAAVFFKGTVLTAAQMSDLHDELVALEA